MCQAVSTMSSKPRAIIWNTTLVMASIIWRWASWRWICSHSYSTPCCTWLMSLTDKSENSVAPVKASSTTFNPWQNTWFLRFGSSWLPLCSLTQNLERPPIPPKFLNLQLLAQKDFCWRQGNLSVVQTCRCYGRSVMKFFQEALIAKLGSGKSQPSLLPQPTTWIFPMFQPFCQCVSPTFNQIKMTICCERWLEPWWNAWCAGCAGSPKDPACPTCFTKSGRERESPSRDGMRWNTTRGLIMLFVSGFSSQDRQVKAKLKEQTVSCATNSKNHLS